MKQTQLSKEQQKQLGLLLLNSPTEDFADELAKFYKRLRKKRVPAELAQSLTRIYAGSITEKIFE